MYAKIVLFSFFFALAAVAEPQVPAAASSVISLAISDATAGAGQGVTSTDSSSLNAGTQAGYTVASADTSKPVPTSSESSAAFAHQAAVQTSLMVGLGTVLVGALLGVTMIL